MSVIYNGNKFQYAVPQQSLPFGELRRGYTYDSVGNIVGQTDNAQQTFYFNNQVVTPTGTYTYDALYRLLTATGREQTALAMPTDTDFVNNIPCPDTATNAMQNYTHNYQYDALGNILQTQSLNQWTRDYFYDTATNRLLRHTQQLPNTYTYDNHGNMLTMPHLTAMAWDYLDQLHNAANGTFTSYYNYDAEGKRTRKVVVKGNIREERYYIGDYEIYRKYINNVIDTERTTLNINDDEKRFAIIDTLTVSGGQTITPVVTIRYQYDNHLGSACLELDELAAIISYEEYHPFGTTSYRSGRSQTEVSLKRYKYCGKERDEETGLYYYGMRYYAAWICRFVSVDPLQFKYPHYTPYQYAGNKPISYIDLDGLEEWSISANITAQNKMGNYSASISGKTYGPYANEKAAFEAVASGAKLYNPTINSDITINDSQKSPTFFEGIKEVYNNSDISFDVIQNLNYLIDHPIDALINVSTGIMDMLSGLLNVETYTDFFSGIYEMTQTSAYQNGIDFALAGKDIITSTMTTAPIAFAGGVFFNSTSVGMRFSYSAANTTTVTEGSANCGWNVGESITNLTIKGNVPAWSTVRQRFWKNEAFFSKSGEYTEFNMLRMQRGLAPQFRNTTTGIMESTELHHTIPQRKGGLFEFIKITPDQHRLIDPFRR